MILLVWPWVALLRLERRSL